MTRTILLRAFTVSALFAMIFAISMDLGPSGILTVDAATSCVNRPRVTLTTVVETGRLRVSVGTQTSATVPTNGLSEIRFAQPVNARIVLVDGTTFSSARTITLASRPTFYLFYVERLGDGALMAPLTAVDACGDWRTFAGGGPSVLTTVGGGTRPGATYEGVPVCTDHDETMWHPLVGRDAAGRITCTYGHEHHADPRAVDDIFGAPGAWYGTTDSISYPWMTTNATTGAPENVAKHEGYKWFVKRDLPCVPFGEQPGCVIAYRAEIHVRGDVSDQTTRFHSFMLEALVQDPQGRRGIVRHGGHIDTGFLALLVNNGNAVVCPPIPQNPPVFTCPFTNAGNLRESSSKNAPAPYTDHINVMPNWYPVHRITQPGPKLEEWGPIDYTNPTAQLFHTQGRRANNSRGRIENLAVDIRSLVPLGLPLASNGTLSYRGYTSRAGDLVQGCTQVAVDCVPLSVESVVPGAYFLNANSHPALATIDEYDVASPVTGNSLIRYPN